LAEQHGFRLESYTKSSCPSVDVTMLLKGVPYAACDEWRANVIEHLAESAPSVVVLSNLDFYPDQGAEGISSSTWSGGMRATLAALDVQSSVFVISDTPSFTETPAACLSANVENADTCSRERSAAVDEPWAAAEAEAAAGEGATVIDVTDYLCTDTECGVIIGAALVYRDAHHLTATFSRKLAPVLWTSLEPALSG
jgi:hypothetical protein